MQTDKLGFKITGGREGGYRGYTYKRHMQPGEWKIDVKTKEGLVLGNYIALFNTINMVKKDLQCVKIGYENCGEFKIFILKEVKNKFDNYESNNLKIIKEIDF